MAMQMQAKASNVLSNLQQNFSRYMNHIKNADVIHKTDLIYNQRLSNKYGCNLFLKREDLQSVRSFKVCILIIKCNKIQTRNFCVFLFFSMYIIV